MAGTVDQMQQHHKLCGFLCVVLSASSSQHDSPNQSNLKDLLSLGSRCRISSDDVGFVTDSGVVLSLIPISEGNGGLEVDLEKGAKHVVVKGKKRKADRVMKERKKVVDGSTLSVVRRIRTLVMNKCLKIDARVVRLEVSSEGEVRVVVLVDVYVRIELWSGWQFSRSGATAAALFSHLSCNWGQRQLWLSNDQLNHTETCHDDYSVWQPSACHVFGCKFHDSVSQSAENKLFDLHQLFKCLPCIGKELKFYSTKICPDGDNVESGIWDISDDVLINILSSLSPKDLIRVAASCCHLRSLAASVMPCLKLKLFPHQQAAVEWMLKRESSAEVIVHPLFMDFSTEDGFSFYMNSVSGEILTGISPTIKDFRGGLFCDEPGLGKTVTAISLILKTHGTIADPPEGVEVKWCRHNSDQQCGYYELQADDLTCGDIMRTWRQFMGQPGRRAWTFSGISSNFDHKACKNIPVSSKRRRPSPSFPSSVSGSSDNLGSSGSPSSCIRDMFPTSFNCRGVRSLVRAKRDLLHSYEGDFKLVTGRRKHDALDSPNMISVETAGKFGNQISWESNFSNSKNLSKSDSLLEIGDTWVQCDACRKWRKLLTECTTDSRVAWFCSMNSDPLYRSCSIPEECFRKRLAITDFPGFYTKSTYSAREQNVLFFTGVLKDHLPLIDSLTKKALTWLCNLSVDKLSEMEVNGLVLPPVFSIGLLPGKDDLGFIRIFEAFGLQKRTVRGSIRWYYPQSLYNLSFDLEALQIALTRPLDVCRLYLSRATLIVVPSNLVEHWKNQILRHVRSGQLKVFVWAEHKQPSAHNLAWDYDVVITTFSRLSIEWGLRKRSVLLQIHWLRVMLDEGHTLGSSLSLTNKLQMAVSLAASRRWLLTGTPTPNTPSSQASHLLPMLKFLHEEAYGKNPKIWEAAVLKPFEAKMEEGRSRLLQILQRCMISARKVDLQTIPPCIKKVTYLHFTEEHAKSYNELVVTVRRNILMADWNDPSHAESLLNPKQWKFRSNTIRNVRLSCCVAGHIKVTDAGQDIQETMDILVQQGLDPLSEEYFFIKHALLNGGSCLRCREWCRLPVITPCRHLLCLHCVSLNSEKCTYTGCGCAYEMQSPEILTRPENPNPKWPVPKDLIELQPSYKQDDWDPDWHATSSSKVSYLVERLKVLLDENRKIGYCLDEKFVHETSERVLVSTMHVDGMVKTSDAKASSHSTTYTCLPEKVIIFSQFLEHIHVIEQQLSIAGIRHAGMYSPMPSANKMKSLMNFQHDPDCMALLMDGSAALGLDLSFVTHVFLMEPIWDRSMEEQVISRAHRMGATRPVYVETLAMHGTIEEQMVEFLKDPVERGRILKQDICVDVGSTRVNKTLHDFAESNYLAQLSFVRTKT